MSARWERKLFASLLERLQGGELTLVEGGHASRHGKASADGLCATLEVHRDEFYRDAVLGGEIGMGEAYMAGAWSSPDLVSLIRLAVRNVEALDGTHSWLNSVPRLINRLRHLGRDNTVEGSRENIRRHYDLSNAFFQLWLDPSLMYSSALWLRGDESLEEAQRNKMDRACQELELGPSDHLLEVGSGWGSMAMHAARNYGCRVTTTTISRQQFELAQARIEAAGLGDRITLLLEDYRHLQGRYTKAVSIEMFEAVGLKHYDAYFSKVASLLEPNGRFLLQTITMNERSFPNYQRGADWIQKYIFPGGELSSVVEIQRSLARCSRLQLRGLEDFGLDYARTLRIWRENFHAQLAAVRLLGFDEQFVRMWDYYLAYCEGAFLEGYIGVAQLRLEAPAPFGRRLAISQSA